MANDNQVKIKLLWMTIQTKNIRAQEIRRTLWHVLAMVIVWRVVSNWI